jgi:hypothetical protein
MAARPISVVARWSRKTVAAWLSPPLGRMRSRHAPQRGVPGQRAGHVAYEVCGLAQALVVAGLLGQVGEQVPQVGMSVPQPPRLGGEDEHGLHHRQGHQLGVAELRRNAHGRPPWPELRRTLQQIIGLHVERGREGVQLCLHAPTSDSPASTAQGIAAIPAWIPSTTVSARSCRRPRPRPSSGAPARLRPVVAPRAPLSRSHRGSLRRTARSARHAGRLRRRWLR